MKHPRFTWWDPIMVVPWLGEAIVRLFSSPLVEIRVGMIDDDIHAIGGLRYCLEGVREGFLFLSPQAHLFPRLIVGIKEEWGKMITPYRRVQFVVNIRRPMDIRFAYYLGMQPEGIMRGAGMRGEDMIMFARVQ